MISVQKLLSDIQRAAEVAGLAGGSSAPPAVDPLRLAGLLVEGEARRLASQQRLGVPVPRFCIFSVTWQCNLNCAGCYTRGYTRSDGLSQADIRRVLRQACDLGCFLFVIVGGEPLLVPGLVDLLAANREALFFLFTNGTLLDRRQVDAVARAGNVLVTLSLEGDDADTAERRGPRAAAGAAAAMKALTDARVPFGFASMVTRRNLRRLTSRAWLDRMWQAGARFGFLIDYVPFPANLRPDYVLTDDDLAYKAAAVRQRYQEARPLVINFPPDEYAFGACQAAGRGFIHVNADGFVEPCPFSHFAADNVKDRPLGQILASPFLRRLRDELPRLPNPHGHCLLFAHADRVGRIAEQTGAFPTEHLPAPSP